MELVINLLNNTTAAASPWVNVTPGQTEPAVIPTPDGADSGWTVAYDPSFAPVAGDTTGAYPTSGDASWVSDEAAASGHTLSEGGMWYRLILVGPPNLDSITVDGFSSSSSDRTTDWRVNGGTLQSLNELNNATNTVTFTNATTAANGELIVEFKYNGGFSRANALRLTVPDGPSITVTQTELTPGGTISGSYSNYETVPTTLTVSDGTNTITIATPTITDNGDGTGTYSGTMPALPATGSTANLVLFGDVTVELS